MQVHLEEYMTKQQAVKHFKTGAKLAEALGITHQAVYDWGDKIPEVRQYQIEVVTKGQLKADRPKQAA
jgi:biotin operon repressor